MMSPENASIPKRAMPGSKNRDIDQITRTFEAFAAYCVETSELVGVDQLALFLHSDGLEVRPAFLCAYGHVTVAFLGQDALAGGVDAFDEGGPVDEMTSSLDQDLPDDTTLTTDNMGAFLGPPLRAMADAQQLSQVVVYLRRDDIDGAMAFKFERGRLFGAADSGTAFVQAIHLVAKAADDAPEDLQGIDLTESVYERLGRRMPEPLPGSGGYLAGFPDDPWAMTGDTVTVPEGDARDIDLTTGAQWAFEEQRKRFIAKFGREPGRGDPVFFNPDADEPEPMTPEQQDAFERMWEAHPELEQMRADAEARLEEHGHVRRVAPKPGRNDPCPCGSAKKFKHCHGR